MKENTATYSSPNEASLVYIRSSLDGTEQPCFFYAPPREDAEPAPLLVSLHTWSADYKQKQEQRLRHCMKEGWIYINPDFRGPNNTPDSMGSDLAVQDVIDAIDEARKRASVDNDRIYLLGFSGGGHMAMLLAGRHPEVWAGVSAWCGISDIAAWHEQRAGSGYARHIEKALRGNPRTDAAAKAEAAKRSPLTWLAQAKDVPLDIAAGIHDGHTGSVPVSHSLEAFNRVAKAEDRLSPGDIASITRDREVPGSLVDPNAAKALLGKAEIHLQRRSGQARVTIFEGGHTGFNDVALRWLSLQRRGAPAVWDSAPPAGAAPGGADMRGN